MTEWRLHVFVADSLASSRDTAVGGGKPPNIRKRFERRVGAAHRPELESLVECEQGTPHVLILRLDQIAGVEVQWAHQLLSRLDRRG